MKLAIHLICVFLSLGAPCLVSLPVWADDDSGLTPYEQRYGQALTPLAASDDTHTSESRAAISTAPAYAPPAAAPPAYAASGYSSAAPTPYQQRYAQASAADAAPAVDNRAELDFSTFYDSDPSSNVNGGSNYGIETTVYSPRLDSNWRLFAGEMYAHELEPFGEGHVGYSRSMVGAEYSNNIALVSLAPTFNDYNGNQRVGAVGNATLALDRQWEIGGGAQLLSRDTPLRALDSGITANSYNLDADLLQDDTRHLRINSEAMTFSDDNVRAILSASDTEHLYKSKAFSVDGLGDVITSHNSEDELRPYFNPRQDVLGDIGAHLGQPLYQSYDIKYDHGVDIKPGVYWQQDYGTSPAVTVSYTQHVAYKNDLDASAGLIYTRQDSDGAAEDDVTVLLNVSEKF